MPALCHLILRPGQDSPQLNTFPRGSILILSIDESRVWASSCLTHIVELLENEHFTRILRKLVVPLVHCGVGSDAHRFADVVDPAVGSNDEVARGNRAGISDTERVLVDWLDRAPGLRTH